MLKLAILSVLLTTNCAVSSLKLEPVKHNINGEPSGFLQMDLSDFLNIIPANDIRNLTEFFYSNDKAMRESYDYLRDDGFKLVVESLLQLTLVKKFTTFLRDNGVNFIELGKRLEGILLTREDTTSIVVNDVGEDMGGIDAFFTEALSLIPQDEVLTLFFVKMEESNAFSSFLEKLNASDYENLTENLKKSQGLQAIYFEFRTHGIDIMEWAKALKSFFGY